MSNLTCLKCNGSMVGDGFTSVLHCEYADSSLYEYHEPDADPVYCDFPEDKPMPADRERVYV